MTAMRLEASAPPTPLTALVTALNYCTGEHYSGYSLYDSHNGRIPFAAYGSRVSFYANQIVKRSPVNLRPMLGIPKGINPKGIGLFLHALAELSRAGIEPPGVDWLHGSMNAEMDFLFRWLRDNPSRGYEGMSWGYNFPWPKRSGALVKPYTPSSVVTGFNARAIYSYYQTTGSEEAAELLAECAKFIRTNIPVTETNEGLCFSYLPTGRDMTINASLLAAEALAYADAASGATIHKADVLRVLEFTRARQNADGSWYYSYSIDTGEPKKQVDFHQGYVLESIRRIASAYGMPLTPYSEILLRGLRFYHENQFDSEGRALWRYPRRWPVDIHNQAEGIITFSLFQDIYPQGSTIVPKILRYTLATMRDVKKGYFYYQKWPIGVTRTPYMRWAQGWMVVALAMAIIHGTADY